METLVARAALHSKVAARHLPQVQATQKEGLIPCADNQNIFARITCVANSR